MKTTQSLEITRLNALASKYVGDGKKPNKYFVSWSNDWGVYNPKESAIEWCGDIHKKHVSTGEMIGMYKTFEEAINVFQEYECLLTQPDETSARNIHRVTMEDRITGVIMETEYIEYSQKSNNGIYTVYEFERMRHDDRDLTRKTLGASFK